MEENGLSILGSHLLLNKSNSEAVLLLKWCGRVNARGGRRKLLLFRDVLVRCSVVRSSPLIHFRCSG